MKILPVVILATLFISRNLPANNIIPSQTMQEGSCPVDAPDSFHSENVSTNWADVAWNLVPGASKYLVKTYDLATGLEVHSVLVSGTTTGTRVSWPDNASGNMEARIWSLCTNNELSPRYESASIIGVILELVATGFQRYNFIENPCTVGTVPDTCAYLPLGPTYNNTFSIQSSPWVPVDRYDVTIESPLHFRLNRRMANNEYIYDIAGGCFTIDRNGVSVARLVPVVTAAGKHYLYRQSINNDYVIRKTGTFASARPTGSSNDRDAIDEAAGLNFEVGPNPFYETLQWQRPAEASTSLVKISLVDLMGVRHICQEIAADQTEGILNTATLASGVYLLQIESAGKLETVKVVKAQ